MLLSFTDYTRTSYLFLIIPAVIKSTCIAIILEYSAPPLYLECVLNRQKMKDLMTRKKERLQHGCGVAHFADTRHWRCAFIMPMNIAVHTLYTGFKGIR